MTTETGKCSLYHFSDFTIENYKKLLLMMTNGSYSFEFYSDQYSGLNEPIVLLRHDVEFSPFVALEMARIENSFGIQSTYFFQIHSDFYNLLERKISNIALGILNLGHKIGLHFDSHYYNIQNEEELESKIIYDSGILENVIGECLDVFSFHNTDIKVLDFKKLRYGGLLNAYSKYFMDRFEYHSDSTGIWRYERLFDVVKATEKKSMQILIHDAMWSDIVMSPKERIYSTIDKNGERVKRQYDATLEMYGAKNIDWE